MLEHLLSNCHGERDALLMSSPLLAYLWVLWRARLEAIRRARELESRTVYLTPREEFDGALLRIEEGVAIYSAERVIDIYMKRGMSEDEARDYFLYNCEGVHVGPFTPRYEWQEFDE